MEGIFSLALLLVFGLPFALLKLAFKLLMLLLKLPLGLLVPQLLQFLSGKSNPREAALSEASRGAAMIVLPVVVLLRDGAALPSVSPWVALALMIVGGFWLYNGGKFSVGWRDPKLLARAAIKIALAVWLFRAIDQRQWWIDPAVDAVGNGLLSLLGWWLLVTGATKLFLVLRGLPSAVIVDIGKPYGPADFANPSDAAKGMKK
jgi:hypothetical protein